MYHTLASGTLLYRVMDPVWNWTDAVSGEGSLLLAGMRRGDLKLWDLGDGRELHVFGRAHGNDVSSVAFDSTGRRAISAGALRASLLRARYISLLV